MRNKYWHLVKAVLLNELSARYAGSLLGVGWAFLSPALMLMIYTFVFTTVLEARWDSGGGTKAEFSLALLIGLLIFNFASECLTRSPSIISSNVSYVKKIVFPLEILPLVVVLSALIHAAIGFGIWAAASIIILGGIPVTAIYLPIVFLPIALFMLGVTWVLSVFGVYLRDTVQVVPVVTSLILFLTPIFYPLSPVPAAFRPWFSLNPLAIVIEQSRNVLLWAKTPNLVLLSEVSLIGLTVCGVGFYFFQRTQKGFADVV